MAVLCSDQQQLRLKNLHLPSVAIAADAHLRLRTMETRAACQPQAPSTQGWFGAVVIGRNEGDRLKSCLASLSEALVVYVDSGSTDDSVQTAQLAGADVVELDLSIPFTAARARNMGFARLQKIAADIPFVLFVDGDCEISSGWPRDAVRFLQSRPDVAAAFGQLRERHPERSVYNWLCDQEWNRPVGEARAFAGNVMVRASALASVGGYREDVIAAEEDELCVRLRAANWRIWRIAGEMGFHDAALVQFGQWWRRSLRAGYAFAQGAHLHGEPPELHFVWERNRSLIWGIFLPAGCLIAGFALPPWGHAFWSLYLLQLVRGAARQSGSFSDRLSLSFFQLLARFPESWGVLKFTGDRLFGRRSHIIEYK
jgi:glycosyltransferase involved in cell wall biosynthesis